MTHSHHARGFSGGVSLTVSLQQYDSHNGSVNIAFRAPSVQHHGGGAGYLFAPTTADHQMDSGVHPRHHVQFDSLALTAILRTGRSATGACRAPGFTSCVTWPGDLIHHPSAVGPSRALAPSEL